jgi:hypothetical protein
MSLIFDAPSARRKAARFVSTVSRLSHSVKPRFRTGALVVECVPVSLLAPPLRVENPWTAQESFASVGADRTVMRPVTRLGQEASADFLRAARGVGRTDFLRALDAFRFARRDLDEALIVVQ